VAPPEPDRRDSTPERPHPHLDFVTPPWQFWLSVVVLVLGGFTSLVALRFDVAELKLWRQETSGNRFTNKDGEQLELKLQKEIELERGFTRTLCKEMVRLARELGRIPANDCNR
jgi:hypothetical protein